MEKAVCRRQRIWQGLGWLTLLLGLGFAAVQYARSGDTADEILGYEVIDGVAYPVRPQDTKQYERQMEVYGGKGLVLADAVMRFLETLRHGRRLAVVAAVGSLGLALGFFYAARLAACGSSRESESDDDFDDGKP